MSAEKPSQKLHRVDFKGRLPRFLAGPPIAFTDVANDNFMRFYFTLLSSSSHNSNLFKKTLGDIQAQAQEAQMCYCEVSTTPIAEHSYKQSLLKARFREYLEELEHNRKDLALYISQNIGVMILLALMSRGLMGTQFQAAKDYREAIDDEKAFRFLAGKFGYRFELVDSLYQFTGKVSDFGIHIGFQMLGGNHSDVVEVLKFRSETPKVADKTVVDHFDQGTESVEVDASFELQHQTKKTSKWEKVRQAFGPKPKPIQSLKQSQQEIDSLTQYSIRSPSKQQSAKKQIEQSTRAKEQQEEEEEVQSEFTQKRFNYLHTHERPLLREAQYYARYRI